MFITVHTSFFFFFFLKKKKYIYILKSTIYIILLIANTRSRLKWIVLSFLELQLHCYILIANITISFEYVDHITVTTVVLLTRWWYTMVYAGGDLQYEVLVKLHWYETTVNSFGIWCNPVVPVILEKLCF